MGAQILAAPSAVNWSTLDDPGIGYVIAGVLSPLFVAIPATIAAGFGHLWRLNRRPRSNPGEFG